MLIRAIIIRSSFDEQCSLSIISFYCDHHLVKIDEKRKMKQKKLMRGRGRELEKIRFCAFQRTESWTNSKEQ